MENSYSSYSEYLSHPVYRGICTEVYERAGGACEVCKHAPATQIHHRVYPAWGTFDTPGNLLAVCYPCHCRIHRKEQ